MGENPRVMMTEDVAPAMAAPAVDAARAALVEQVGEGLVGGHVDAVAEGEGVVTHYFESRQAGYPGWRWAVTVAHVNGQDGVTIDEVVLLPGQDAIIAPPWVPWRERIRPGDLSPGDVLPAEEDDPRLVPAYLSGDPGDGAPRDAADQADRQQIKTVSEELGLGRVRVLSRQGRNAAAERWYAGDGGPRAEIALRSTAECRSCGYFVPMPGALRAVFGVCANEWSPSDGRVVALTHGCGAHSETDVASPAPEPIGRPIIDDNRLDLVD